MKVGLFIPPGSIQRPIMPFFGLGTITAYLKEHGIDVVVNDFSEMECNPSSVKEITRIISGMDLDLIGFSLLNRLTPEPLRFVMALAESLKNESSTRIVIGGAYSEVGTFSSIYRQIMERCRSIDYCIDAMFSGEEPFRRLCEAKDLKDVPNLLYREGESIRNTVWKFHRKVIVPDFSGFDLSVYRKNAGLIVLPFQLMSGCTYRCAFCLDYDKSPHILDPEEAVDGLEKISKLTRNVYFLDRTINMDPVWLDKFCDLLIKRDSGIKWTDCAFPARLDSGLLKKMKAAGCVRLIFGMESANDRMLKYLKKPTTIKLASKIFMDAADAGIQTVLELIVGFPHEKEEVVQSTIDFLRENRSSIAGAYVNTFELKTPSLMQEQPREFGLTGIAPLRHRIGEFTFEYGNRFDEIDGLLWDKVQERAFRHLQILKKGVGGHVKLFTDDTNQEDVYSLFNG